MSRTKAAAKQHACFVLKVPRIMACVLSGICEALRAQRMKGTCPSRADLPWFDPIHRFIINNMGNGRPHAMSDPAPLRPHAYCRRVLHETCMAGSFACAASGRLWRDAGSISATIRSTVSRSSKSSDSTKVSSPEASKSRRVMSGGPSDVTRVWWIATPTTIGPGK